LKDDRGNNEQASGGAAVRPPQRGRRRVRRAATAGVLLLAVVGATSIQRFFFGRPGVGHFRSVEGRAAYVEAYERVMSALPPPTAYDVVTDLGTVHAYEWSSPALRSRFRSSWSPEGHRACRCGRRTFQVSSRTTG